MNYTGFVYIWFDKKYHRFYIGSHKGNINDRYIGSNVYLKNAYKLRPFDFKRRILCYCSFNNISDLHKKEQYFLDMIKEEELYSSINIRNNTVRYYNIKSVARGGSQKGRRKSKKKNIPAWNKGYSIQEIKMRSAGLLCFLSDKPIIKPRKKANSKTTNEIRTEAVFCCRKCFEFSIKPRRSTIMICKKCQEASHKVCPICSLTFIPAKKQTIFCSKSCSGKNNGSLTNGSKNGKMGSKKQSATVSGRRKTYKDDGSWTWHYPDKNRESF